MFDLGWGEILVCVVVTILVFGPKDLPRLLRRIGQIFGQTQRLWARLRHEFDLTLLQAEEQARVLDQNPRTVQDPLYDIKEALKKAKATPGEIQKKTQKRILQGGGKQEGGHQEKDHGE